MSQTACFETCLLNTPLLGPPQIPKTVVTAMRHHAWAKGSSGSRHASATARWLGVEEEAPGGSTRFMASFHPLDQFTVREVLHTRASGWAVSQPQH